MTSPTVPDAELIERLTRFAEVYGDCRGMPWIGVVRPEQAFAQAASRLAELQAEGTWQPIETFAEPTSLSSGSGVLVAASDGTVGEAYFRNFDDEDRGWWWANTSWGDYPEPERPNPTHWMPLPEAPALSASPIAPTDTGRSPSGRAAAADAVEPISVVSSKASIPNAGGSHG